MTDLTWHEETIKLKDLKEYSRNPRRIDKDQFEKLVTSIKENGYNNRVLCDLDNTILGGHMRTKAFKKAGFKDNDDIPVLKPNRKLTEEEFRRINIQDNVGFGEWDIDQLANDFEIPQLLDWGLPEDLFKGIEPEEEEEEVEEEEEQPNKEDEIPEVKKTITQHGDIWILGNHKLVCGDSFDVNNHKTLMGDEYADFCFIDPPYGIKIDYWDNPIDIQACMKFIDGLTKENSFFAFTQQMPALLDYLKALENTQYKFKDHIIWVKRTPSNLSGLQKTHETLMIYKKGKPEYVKTKGKYSDVKVPGLMFDVTNIEGIKRHISQLHQDIKEGRKKIYKKTTQNHNSYKHLASFEGSEQAPEEVNFTNVWSFLSNNQANRDLKSEGKRLDHPTIKPIMLLERLLELCCGENEKVLDLFLGSGTTLLAAEKTNRICHGFEISPYYCDIIVKRWQELTGEEAYLQNSGKTYNQLEQEADAA
jgi:DNA modification methylase